MPPIQLVKRIGLQLHLTVYVVPKGQTFSGILFFSFFSFFFSFSDRLETILLKNRIS